MEPEGLIFDCDGTLVDTMPIHFKAWSSTTKVHGLVFPEDRFYALGGVLGVSLSVTVMDAPRVAPSQASSLWADVAAGQMDGVRKMQASSEERLRLWRSR